MEYPFPPRFFRLHRKQLGADFHKYGEIFNIIPREPPGEPITEESGPCVVDVTVTLVQVRRVIRNGRMYVGAATPEDQKVAQEWEERHRNTTDEEFDWFPKLGEAENK